jgi:hypothetical protein
MVVTDEIPVCIEKKFVRFTIWYTVQKVHSYQVTVPEFIEKVSGSFEQPLIDGLIIER